MKLTSRDFDLLETLTRRVRLLTVLQVAQIWWPDRRSQTGTRRRIEELARTELVELKTLSVHPLLPVDEPLFHWKPGAASPDVDAISQRCTERWSQPDILMTVCVATRRAANLFGSSAWGTPPHEHRNHDLRLADVYASYRRRQPKLAARWTGEHALSKAGFRVKDPDAFLCFPDGRIQRVIESAGSYGPQQVRSFHMHCAARKLPYELW